MQTTNLPKHITFTGVDEHTDIRRLIFISGLFHGKVEWGILLSPNMTGKHIRYPALETVNEVLNRVTRFPIKMAAHLCGGYAREVLAHGSNILDPFIKGSFGRVQLNASGWDFDAERLNLINGWKDKVGVSDLILQCRVQFPSSSQVHWLFDNSGGKGIFPKNWLEPAGSEFRGYAGGIDPENVESAVINIGQKCQNYWLDMETGVRTDDKFDLDKCLRVLETVYGRV